MARKVHLRSRSVCSSFSRALAFIAKVSTRGIRSSTSTSALMVRMRVAGALNILHSLIIIATTIVVVVVAIVAYSGKLSVHIHLFALQEPVNNITNLPVPRAEPGGIARAALRLRLQPEQVSLR